MRIDSELFAQFKRTQRPFFRTYSWEDGVTYGVAYTDSDLTRLGIPADDVHVAKRLTGGGILHHGNDISYAFAIPTSYVGTLSVKASYEALCEFLLHFYKSLGLSAQFAINSGLALEHHAFCQKGFEPYDIVIHNRKIGGNAQRRSKQGIFMHGSIAMIPSAHGLGTSLQEFGVDISAHDAQRLLINAFANTFNITFHPQHDGLRHAC